MAAPLEEITAIYVAERFRFSNADGDVVIAECRPVNGSVASLPLEADQFGTGSISVKGKADLDELQPHQTYRFYGRWSEYTNKRTNLVEKQFAFQTFIRAEPHGRAGVVSYLKQAGKGNGIGQARATKLWEKFGSDAVRILREQPEVAVAAISGLQADDAQSASDWLKDEQRLEGATIDLIDLLTGRGFPKDTARRAIKEWGNRAVSILRRDPYSLMRFRGCGFKRTDAMWLDLGLNPNRLRRQALCAWYAVASDTEGHTWYPVEHAVEGLRAQVGGTELRPASAIKLATKIGKLGLDRNGALSVMRSDKVSGSIIQAGGQVWLAEGRKAWSESKLAELIADSKSEIVQWPDLDQVQGISEHQREHLANSLTGVVGILGGGPGTGKTFTAASLIALLVDVYGPEQIGIGAPTGKAAVRISEAMQAHGLPIRARTWHSLLGVGSVDELTGLWGFNHNENNPLPYKVLIGDESSMLDTTLLSNIFRARAIGTHVLLVGDVNQLPPVGHGAPLRDMIAAGLPYGELREIKRNSGGIVEACAAIRDSKRWEAGDNLVVDQQASPPQQVEAMLRQLESAKEAGLDPVWECQVVCAVNAKSKLSRKDLNKVLQEELNKSEKVPGSPFRVGDKVVNLKNGFFPAVDVDDLDDEVQTNDRDECYVANGELARVVSVEEKMIVARLSNPNRTIKIPRGKSNDADDSQDGGDGANSDKTSTGCSWDLGYCLSVHKSQGSEWKWVLVMIDDYPGAKMVCSREWLYTSISRAREKCVLIGKKSVADGFCRRVAIKKRKTFLKELIHLKTVEKVLVEL